MQQPLCYNVCEYILGQKLPPEFYCKSIWGYVKSKTKKNFDKVAPCFTWCWSFTRAGANFTPFQQAAYRPHAKHNKMVMTVGGNASPKNSWRLFVERILVSSSCYNVLQPHVLFFFKDVVDVHLDLLHRTTLIDSLLISLRQVAPLWAQKLRLLPGDIETFRVSGYGRWIINHKLELKLTKYI